MKRILLLCLAALLLMQGVCLAKIEKQVDNFEGDYCYLVHHSTTDSIFDILGSSFVVFFSPDNKYDGKVFELFFYNKGGYAIDKTIKMQVEDTIYTWKTENNSFRGNGFVRCSFPIPDKVYNALMQTKKNVAIRFYYSALSGDYMKDYVIPSKIIKEAQTMFTTYVPKTEPPAQPAK